MVVGRTSGQLLSSAARLTAQKSRGTAVLTGMDTRTALALALGALAVYAAYRNPELGTAIGVGVIVVTLLLAFLK